VESQSLVRCYLITTKLRQSTASLQFSSDLVTSIQSITLQCPRDWMIVLFSEFFSTHNCTINYLITRDGEALLPAARNRGRRLSSYFFSSELVLGLIVGGWLLQ
jgi:hypothetical protein